jgi:hypothetical protein
MKALASVVLYFLLLQSMLVAKELSFESLRQDERTLVLHEFKKLYKIRQDIHQNLRQVLKHSRAKNLNKNHLSFFQPKSIEKESNPYQIKHPIEASNVFLFDKSENYDETQNTSEVSDGQEISGGTEVPGSAIDVSDSSLDAPPSDIRKSVTSPWALR